MMICTEKICSDAALVAKRFDPVGFPATPSSLDRYSQAPLPSSHGHSGYGMVPTVLLQYVVGQSDYRPSTIESITESVGSLLAYVTPFVLTGFVGYILFSAALFTTSTPDQYLMPNHQPSSI